MSLKIVIIGAGPTGLGAAWRLMEMGFQDFVVLEQNSYPGGLSASFTDPKGFVWDLGGHVTHCKTEPVRRFFESMLGQEWVYHLRESFIRVRNRWVPYPFQNNLRHLPSQALWECLEGLMEAEGKPKTSSNLKDWILSEFGPGIAKHFMLPYNQKIWTHPLERISAGWVQGVVNSTSVKSLVKSLVFGTDNGDFGCNHKFSYPLRGGTGEIFRAMLNKAPDRIFLNKKVTRCVPPERMLYLQDGSKIKYDFLINTSPLPLFLHSLEGHYDGLKEASSELVSTKLTVVGLGFKRPMEDKKCWMYFPEPEFPFYRVTPLSKYSPYNTPDVRSHGSFLCEFSGKEIPSGESLMERAFHGLHQAGLVLAKDKERIVSEFHHTLEHAYPIPTLERDKALSGIHLELNQLNIHSIGLLGGWKYEKGSMEDCLLEGMHTMDRILNGDAEGIELWKRS